MSQARSLVLIGGVATTALAISVYCLIAARSEADLLAALTARMEIESGGRLNSPPPETLTVQNHVADIDSGPRSIGPQMDADEGSAVIQAQAGGLGQDLDRLDEDIDQIAHLRDSMEGNQGFEGPRSIGEPLDADATDRIEDNGPVIDLGPSLNLDAGF